MAASSQVTSTGFDAATKMRSPGEKQYSVRADYGGFQRGSSSLELGGAIGGGSPCRQSCGPHELAWGAGGVLRPLTHLIALVEQLDFLHLFERFIERELGVVKLRAQLCRRTFEIFPPLHRRLGVSGIGEMIRIVDASAILLGLYL